MIIEKSLDLTGKPLRLETGKLAKQADGAVVVRYGDTVVLATVVASRTPLESEGFFPLSVEYREKAYAVGKIPGGFFKREGKPAEKEVLSARLVDRPIRPLFPKFFPYEVQVFVSVLSSDREHDADVLGIIGASAAVSISDISAGRLRISLSRAISTPMVRELPLVIEPVGRRSSPSRVATLPMPRLSTRWAIIRFSTTMVRPSKVSMSGRKRASQLTSSEATPMVPFSCISTSGLDGVRLSAE